MVAWAFRKCFRVVLVLGIVVSQWPGLASGQQVETPEKKVRKKSGQSTTKDRNGPEPVKQSDNIIEKTNYEIAFRKKHRIKSQKALVSLKGAFKYLPFETKSFLLSDSAGRITKFESYERTVSLYEDDLYLEVYEFEYDAQNNIKAYRKNTNYGVKLALEFEYDSAQYVTKIMNGKKVMKPEEPKYNHLLPSLFSYFVYPYKGFVKYFNTELFRYQEVGASGKLLSKSKLVVSEENKVMQMMLFSEWLHDASITAYQYNDQGNEIGRLILDKRGKPLIRLAFTYTPTGLLESVTWQNRKGKPTKVVRYEYEFY